MSGCYFASSDHTCLILAVRVHVVALLRGRVHAQIGDDQPQLGLRGGRDAQMQLKIGGK